MAKKKTVKKEVIKKSPEMETTEMTIKKEANDILEDKPFIDDRNITHASLKRKDNDTMITELMGRVVFLEQRIDVIVSAIDKSKTVRGL